MDAHLARTGFRRALASCHYTARRRLPLQQHRRLATPTEPTDEIRAAPPIRFTDDANQFGREPQEGHGLHRAGQQAGERQARGRGRRDRDGKDDAEKETSKLLRRVRIVPRSPSYFTAAPLYTDDFLFLSALQRRHLLLPVLPTGEAPKVAWKTYAQYKVQVQEPVKAARYQRLVTLLKRLNLIHVAVMPQEVKEALERYKRDIQPSDNVAKPIIIDEYGRARAVGRRKSSNAVAYLVEGEGEVLINGRSLTEYFGRLHDRESAVWALKATDRLDKYNVFAVAHGGGTTGQAEAITLGVAKALLAHEPALKPALRKAGCIKRDPRRVERKKPGKLKARKMPAWVKR